MKKYLLTAAAALGAVIGSYAADNDPVLMTIAGHDVHVSEFEYLYNKNNTQQVQPQTLDQYLNMFVDYKLKVADAEAAGLDTMPSFVNEYNGYKRELSTPYMFDRDVQERLVQEAYDRRRTDVRVSHIMFQLPDRALADSVLREIRAGHLSFEDAAEQYSIDGGSKHNGGMMGYVTPDRFPYAFEKAAYTTPVGGITDIVNSGQGLHIIRVEESTPTRGEVLVEHILLLTRGMDDEQKEAVHARIDSLYRVATAPGADFRALAHSYSQDPGSARNGGELPWFGSGRMVAEFDSAAFATPVGTVSEPFMTRFGYHIIHKKDRRGLAPLDELREQILSAMSNDERASIPSDAVVERIRAEKHAKTLPKTLRKVRSIIQKNGAYDSTAIAKLNECDLVIATYDGGAPITVRQIMPRVAFTLSTDIDNGVNLVAAAAETTLRQNMLDAYRDELAQTNPDYRNLLNEYRDGILLYEISTRKVWDRAARDTTGLEEYFRANIRRYNWDQPKFKSAIIFAASDSLLNEALEYAATLPSDNPAAFNAAMREHFGSNVKVERVIAAQGENPITDYLAFGGDKPAADARSRWTAYAAFNGRLIEAPETAADVRGAAVTDYQAELERQWVEELHHLYPVNINNDVFEALKAFRQQ